MNSATELGSGDVRCGYQARRDGGGHVAGRPGACGSLPRFSCDCSRMSPYQLTAHRRIPMVEIPIEVSIVMPCLNEARTLSVCIEKAFASFARLGISGEVIVADNGSTDGSQAIATRCGARLVHQPIKGYGAALSAGLESARGEFLIMGDSDDSYDWADIESFILKMRNGCDVVMGNRFKGGIAPGAMPWHHRYFGNPFLSFISRIAFNISVGDFHCGMRGFTRKAFAAMRPETTGMEFATEMISSAARLGLRIEEVPVKLHPDGRDRPPHLRSFRDGWRHLRFILTYAPDHIYLLPGSAMLFAGMLLQFLLAAGPIEVVGRYIGIHYLALGGLLSLVGFNVISMGVQSKVIMSLRYPRLRTTLVRWALERFKLERGLILGGFIAALGSAVLISVLVAWLQEPGRDMESSVHPVFASAQAFALGVNIVFSSFMLQLLRGHHAYHQRAPMPQSE